MYKHWTAIYGMCQGLLLYWKIRKDQIYVYGIQHTLILHADYRKAIN